MTAPFTPFAEPWYATALRTILLALLIGVVTGLAQHRAAEIPGVTLFALWFTLGGHFVELFFLNWFRQQVSGARGVQAMARIAIWFVGGALLFAGAMATRGLFADPIRVGFSWWIAGAGFVVIEMLIHGALRARGSANFYDGRG